MKPNIRVVPFNELLFIREESPLCVDNCAKQISSAYKAASKRSYSQLEENVRLEAKEGFS